MPKQKGDIYNGKKSPSKLRKPNKNKLAKQKGDIYNGKKSNA